MTAERWRVIEAIYNGALERSGSERSQYLVDACGSDTALRREIEALLAEGDTPGEAMLDRPAWEHDTTDSLPIVPGARLGPYEVLAPIGAGGMGQVFRARDTRLGRMVAIKVAKSHFSSRFEREARAIAALNHSNVCTLYDVGPDYLVMELVEGAPLQGPLPLPRAIELACQILDALDAAHKRGIVHRDLKPANILLTKSGVKVLDFGLARVSAKVGADVGAKPGPADEAALGKTQPGMILGTLCYMAPEQLQGRDTDARADIFAFGCVLYEMLTGKRAFEGSDAASVISAVMERPAPSLEGVAPPALDRLLQKCLEKDPEQRWESAKDLKTELVWAGKGELTKEPPARARGWIAAALAFALAGSAIAFIHFREKPAPTPGIVRFQVLPPGTAKMQPTSQAVLSPDGRRIAFAVSTPEGGRLAVEDLSSGAARVYPETQVGGNVPPSFWSPDSKYLAYSGLTKLQRLEVETGELTAICDKPGPVIGGAWNSDGVIIFGSTTASLWTVHASGGKVEHLTALDASRSEVSHQLPQFLPDGKHFLYYAGSSIPAKSGIMLSSLDRPTSARLLVEAPSGGQFVPGEASGEGEPNGTGRLLWYREGGLVAQPFDLRTFTLRGEPTRVLNSVGVVYQTTQFSASRDVLVYRNPGTGYGFQFFRLDPKTGRTTPLGEPDLIQNAAVSPDETRIAYTRQGNDIRILDLARGTSVSLTMGSGEKDAQWPAWSPDGKEIAYTASEGGRYRVLRRAADGSGTEKLVFAASYNVRPVQWSPDGRFLLVDYLDTHDQAGEGVLAMQPGAVPFRISHAYAAGEACGEFSPNGKYLAYCAQEDGRTEVFVKPFIPNEGIQDAPRWMISDHGGRRPLWSKDSRRIFYWSEAARALYSVEISDSNGFHAGTPVKYADLPAETAGVAQAQTSRGDVILRLVANPAENAAIHVIVNWRRLLAGSGERTAP